MKWKYAIAYLTYITLKNQNKGSVQSPVSKLKEQRIKKNKVNIFMFLKSPRQKVKFCQYKPLKKNEANKLVKSHEVRFHLVYVYVLAVSCTGYILFH